MKNSIKYFLSIIFLICLLEMNYSYYIFVRIAGMVGFIFLANLDKNNKKLFYFWIFSAILINPFFKITFGRFLWNIIDVIWAIILISSIYIEKKNKYKQDEYYEAPYEVKEFGSKIISNQGELKSIETLKTKKLQNIDSTKIITSQKNQTFKNYDNLNSINDYSKRRNRTFKIIVLVLLFVVTSIYLIYINSLNDTIDLIKLERNQYLENGSAAIYLNSTFKKSDIIDLVKEKGQIKVYSINGNVFKLNITNVDSLYLLQAGYNEENIIPLKKFFKRMSYSSEIDSIFIIGDLGYITNKSLSASEKSKFVVIEKEFWDSLKNRKNPELRIISQNQHSNFKKLLEERKNEILNF